MKLKLTALAAVVLLISPFVLVKESHALSSVTPTDFSSLTNAMTASFVRTVAVGADHRAYMSAAPLGSVIGLDVGVDLTVINTPSDFKSNLAIVGAGSVPDLLPLPRLNIHKGLPFGVDLGFSYIGYSGYTIMGGDLKWAFINNAVLPVVAFRVGYTKTKLFFMDTKSWKFDLLASKSLGFIDPYAGFGLQALSGDLVVPATTSIPVGVSGSHSQSPMHVFGGMALKMVLLKLTLEIDHSFADITTYGAKFSFSL